MKNKQLKLKLSTRIAILFGIFRFLGLEQLSAIFKTSKGHGPCSSVGIRGWISRRFKVHQFTPAWMSIYYLWVDKCSSEEEAIDAFFSGYNYGFSEGDGKWRESPLKEAGCLKLLEFLTDHRDNRHRRFVWNFTNNHWMSSGSKGAEAAMQRRAEFVSQLIDSARNSIEADVACSFAQDYPRRDARLIPLFEKAVARRNLLHKQETAVPHTRRAI